MNIENHQELSDFVHEVNNTHHKPISILEELIERQQSRVDHYRREKANRLDDLYKSDSYFIPMNLRKSSYSISSRNLEKELLSLHILQLKLTNYQDETI